MNIGQFYLKKSSRLFSRLLLEGRLMQKQFAVICLDMYTLSIFQKVNLKHSLSFFKYSSTDNSDSCSVLRDFPRTSWKLLRKVYRTPSYYRWHCKSLATSLNLRKGNLSSGLLECTYILSLFGKYGLLPTCTLPSSYWQLRSFFSERGIGELSL